MFSEPDRANAYLEQHVTRLLSSYAHWTGEDLLQGGSGASLAESLYRASFVVISHGTQTDPIFNYGNLSAQQLFEMDWSTLTALPSRCSAEPVERAERARLMATVSAQGFIDDYRGVRVSASGKRFMIERATVWNVLDENGTNVGQAATFSEWTPLPDRAATSRTP